MLIVPYPVLVMQRALWLKNDVSAKSTVSLARLKSSCMLASMTTFRLSVLSDANPSAKAPQAQLVEISSD